MPSFDRSVICPVLIGHASAVKTLRQHIDTARTGQGQTLLISGEAGIGKSRLTREMGREAIQQGYQLLQGSCYPYDVDYPYAPILDLLRTHLADDGAEDRAFLTRERFSLLPEIIPPSLDAAQTLNPEQEKRRLFAILTQFFVRKAAQQPVFCVIEDVHWSDDISLEFLHYLARHCAGHRLLLLITYRSDEIHSSLQNWLAQMDRDRLALELLLEPLSRTDVEALLSAIYGQPHPLRADFVETLHTLTEGNPFFIEEVLKSLSSVDKVFLGSASHVSSQELRIPRSVQAAVRERFALLSDHARQMITLAAVIGRQFDFDLLQKLTHLDEYELLRIIRELIAAQLITEQSSDQFAFRHALTRQAIYTMLLARERKALHQQIGELIEQMYAPSLESRAADLAHHFYTAGVWDKALQYALSAGKQAFNLYALNAASEHFTRALDAARQIDGLPLIELYTQRGQIYELLGEFERARHDLETALDRARAQGDRAAEWKSLLALGFLWASRDYRRTGDYYREALELAQTMNDPTVLGHSLNRLGNWHVNADQPSEGQKYHHEARRIFEELDDQRGLAETIDLLGMACVLGGDFIRGSAYYKQAAAYFSAMNDRAGLVSSLTAGAIMGVNPHTDVVVSPPEPTEVVLQRVTTALQIARAAGLRAGEAFALGAMSFNLSGLGDYQRALSVLEQSEMIAQEIEHHQWLLFAQFGKGIVFTDIFALDAAQRNLESALQLATETHSHYWRQAVSSALAIVYILQNRLAEARAVLDAVNNAQTPAESLAQRMCWRARAKLALAQEDGQTALKITDTLFATALNLDQSKEGIIVGVSLVRGEALLRLERFEEAVAELVPLTRFLEECAAASYLWRADVALGKAYLGLKRADEAEDAFQTARQITVTVAKNIPDAVLRDNFLIRANALIPQSSALSPRQALKKAFGGLTTREREIAGHIAQGKSNREISDLLIISERTVEAHVSNILNKLGFNSRTQIAAWAAEKGLYNSVDDL